MDKPSAQLLGEWMRGGQTAADELFRRYIGRLTALARGKISRRLGRRLDPEDVALSAYRSFFVRARTGRVSLEYSGDMWRLLTAIAVNKLHRQVLHHRAGKRSMDREQPMLSAVEGAVGWRPVSGPSPNAENAAIMAEELERFVAELSQSERQILELRMQDYPQHEIASRIGKTERTVRRVLTDLQQRLEQRLLEPDSVEDRKASCRTSESPAAAEILVEASAPQAINDGAACTVQPASSPQGALSVGEWLSDEDFQLSRHLGTGGSGKVYQAWWRATNEWVAVKVLKKRIQSDREAVDRFMREAVTVSTLRHPGIVPIRGIGRLRSGGYFLVLEFLPGGDLSALMKERRIELAEALGWVAAAAAAVEHAHSHGVIHCDLKPSNLLLDSCGMVRVTDFGLAHIRGKQADHLVPAGTLGFMAPEQIDASRGNVGPQTDVFGLGAVLFALLTGYAPSIADTLEQTISQILDAPPPSLRVARPDIPEAVDAICQRCLSRRFAERFDSAAELSRALRELGK